VPKIDPDAALVAALLHQRYRVTCTPIPRSAEKTPDLECVGVDGEKFVCEVKTLNDDPDWPPADGKGHVKRDNTPERVRKVIAKAHAQLAGDDRPRVLAIVNRVRLADVRDLDSAFSGRLTHRNEDGSIHHIDASGHRVAWGKIKDKKTDIDLYIWIDVMRGRRDNPEVWFRVHEEAGEMFACRAFGVPPFTREQAR